MVGETYVGLVAILAPFISIVLHNLHLAPGLALNKTLFRGFCVMDDWVGYTKRKHQVQN